MKTNKLKIRETVYSKHFDGDLHIIRFSDLPKDIREDDIIEIKREDSYYSENDSWDAYTNLEIIREREETDEEYQKRMQIIKDESERLRKRRYETYLKLLEEFGGLNYEKEMIS